MSDCALVTAASSTFIRQPQSREGRKRRQIVLSRLEVEKRSDMTGQVDVLRGVGWGFMELKIDCRSAEAEE